MLGEQVVSDGKLVYRSFIRAFHIIARPIIWVGSSLNAWNALKRIEMKICEKRVISGVRVKRRGESTYNTTAREGAGGRLRELEVDRAGDESDWKLGASG